MLESNRRRFFMQMGGLVGGLGLFPRHLAAQATSSYEDDMPDMLLSYLSGKLNVLADRWNQERDKIQTPTQLEARNRFVRNKFQEMIHGYPERNPLNPIVTGVLQREGYRVEKVLFESRPNFWVTGSLYIPTSGSDPFPGIISPCGHSPLGRMQPNYQFAYMDMVRSGFVVLAYDPIGQGERRQYWNPQTQQADIADPVFEHSMPGQILLLLGEDLTQYRIWDGMRAIDYLLTRPEVDKGRIGCAGHSGGGTLTLFISALDERVQCAVVSEGGTTHRWPQVIRPDSLVGPADVEQNLFPAALYGIDLCDLHVAIAPRPLLVLIENYSPAFNATADHIRARYRQAGVPEKFAAEEAADPHGWTVKLRLATADWFCRWFNGQKGPVSEPELQPECPESLYCTPTGSLRYASQGDTIFSLILKKQARLPPPRKMPETAAELESYRLEISQEIRSLLRYKAVNGPLDIRRLTTTPRKGYHIEKLEFLSEPGIYIPTWVFVPDRARAGSRAILWVSEAGKEADGMEFGALEKLARKGCLVVAVDVRGIGDTRPRHDSEITEPSAFRQLFDVETAMSYMAWFMDESLLGMRVQDVVRSVDYALGRADVDQKGVHIIGTGMGALWALYAAVLDMRIAATICDGGLVCYRNLAQADRYLHGANVFIPDVLRHLDLPQVAAAVADRFLCLLAPVDAMKQPVEPASAREAYRCTAATYQNVRAADRFRIIGRNSEIDASDQYLDIFS